MDTRRQHNMSNIEERLEILIGRVVDEEASDADWSELESLAAGDASVWRRLALTRREHDALRAGFEHVAAGADRIEAEAPGPALATILPLRSARFGAWSGWAAAAALGLAWLGVTGINTARQQPAAGFDDQSEVAAVSPASFTADEMLDQYMARGMREGWVLGELPKVMVETRPADEGDRYEVRFIRQIYERAYVDHFYEEGFDELGETQLVPLNISNLFANQSL
ncbi:MAG: hypothetical protein EA376_14285 [Phycisphaeraceae bacterium]|nr:MAG: hypothetical protein EA376_14285 [Phycisphaeraceae bacterium]